MSVPIEVYRRFPRRLPKELRFSNYCLDFDATEDYMLVGNPVSLNFGDVLTLIAWIKIHLPANDWRCIIGKDANPPRSYNLMLTNTNVLRFGYFIGGVAQVVNSLAALPTEIWLHVAATFRSGYQAVYLNSIFQNSRADVGAIDLTAANIVIGAFSHLASGWVNSKIDEVSIIRDDLSPEEIVEDFHRGYARRLLTSRLNLRLEEQTGLIAYDSSGHGNNGSLLPALTPPTWTRVAKHELLVEAGV